MSEGQGATAQAPGNPGNTGNGSQGSRQAIPSSQGETKPVQESTTGDAPALPKRQKASKTQGEGTQQPGSGETAPGVPPKETREPEESRVKLKVYGEEREFDLNNVEDRKIIIREAQQSLAAQKKFQEATKKEAVIQQIWDTLQNNPEKALQAAGHDVLELAKARVAEQMRQEMMDPNERARIQEQKRREHVEAQLNQRIQQEQKQRMDAEKAHHADRWQRDILGALDKVSDLPKDPATVRLIAQNILDAKANGINVTAEEAAQYTRHQVQATLRTLASKMSSGQLVSLLGKENLDKIRQHFVDEVQSPHRNTFAKAPSNIPQEQPKPTGERRFKDWTTYREELERKVQS